MIYERNMYHSVHTPIVHIQFTCIMVSLRGVKHTRYLFEYSQHNIGDETRFNPTMMIQHNYECSPHITSLQGNYIIIDY